MRENECSGLKSVSFHVVRRSVGQKRSGPAPCVRLGVVEGGGGGRVTVVAYGDGQRALQWQLSPWMYLQGGCPSLTAKDPFWLLSGCVGTWWYAVPCSPEGLTSPPNQEVIGNTDSSCPNPQPALEAALGCVCVHPLPKPGPYSSSVPVCSHPPRDLSFYAVCPPP